MRLARYAILIALVAVLSILAPLVRGEQLFLTPNNLLQVGQQAAINAIIAVGMTFVIISGGIDLSVGSIVALGGVVAALVLRSGGSAWIGFGAAVSVGLACGALNGVLITRVNVPPFIVTLGTMGVFRGLALILSGGLSIYGFGRDFSQLFAGRIGEIPVQVIVAALVALMGALLLAQTRFGKYTIAIGGGQRAARLLGVPVRRYKIGVYALSGGLTGAASALLLARLSSGDPTFGVGFELDAIAAVVMGGTSLSGGVGSIGGTIIGALIISLIRNAINLFNVPSYWQELVIGVVIVLAVTLDQWRKRERD